MAALVVEATNLVTASIDDDDNRFLECAAAAGAEYLITGNLKHYPTTWNSCRVVNARGRFSQGVCGPDIGTATVEV